MQLILSFLYIFAVFNFYFGLLKHSSLVSTFNWVENAFPSIQDKCISFKNKIKIFSSLIKKKQLALAIYDFAHKKSH